MIEDLTPEQRVKLGDALKDSINDSLNLAEVLLEMDDGTVAMITVCAENVEDNQCH